MTERDDLTLVIGQRELRGWTEISVTRGIEQCPSVFELGMTELYGLDAQALTVQPGDACEVRLGQDLVITGYVDVFAPSIEPRSHTIRVSGRGQCQDLVDCSAQWPGGLIANNTALGIAQKLAAPHGIGVVAVGAPEIGPPVPQFLLIVTETPWDIIERVCRYRALIPYELADGRLAIAAVGTTRAASGVTEGGNVQRGQARFSANQRFGRYQAFLLDTDPFTDAGIGTLGLYDTQIDASYPAHRAHRVRSIVAEAAGGGAGLDVVKRRNTWELNRRRGRSFELLVTVDSWRDASGALWEPNTLVPLSLPSLKLDGVEWLLSRVTYHRNAGRGTTADLTLMPAEAFAPMPVVFTPLAPDVALALAPPVQP